MLRGECMECPYTRQRHVPSSRRSPSQKRPGPHPFGYVWRLHYIGWRRKWHPMPVFLPGESRGQMSLVGCCPWGCTESVMTEATQHACMHWRGKWHPTPVLLPGESQGRGSLVGGCLWGHTELDTTEVRQQQQQHYLGMAA